MLDLILTICAFGALLLTIALAKSMITHGCEGATVAGNDAAANANLMAAAPELLEALRRIRSQLVRERSVFVVESEYPYLTAAIQKAVDE